MFLLHPTFYFLDPYKTCNHQTTSIKIIIKIPSTIFFLDRVFQNIFLDSEISSKTVNLKCTKKIYPELSVMKDIFRSINTLQNIQPII